MFFREVRRGPCEYRLANRYVLVSRFPHPSQQLSTPFPLQPCAPGGTKEALSSAPRTPRMLRVLATQFAVSSCGDTDPDVSGLLAAPGRLFSASPLKTSPPQSSTEHPTNSGGHLGLSLAAGHGSVYSSPVDTL